MPQQFKTSLIDLVKDKGKGQSISNQNKVLENIFTNDRKGVFFDKEFYFTSLKNLVKNCDFKRKNQVDAIRDAIKRINDKIWEDKILRFQIYFLDVRKGSKHNKDDIILNDREDGFLLIYDRGSESVQEYIYHARSQYLNKGIERLQTKKEKEEERLEEEKDRDPEKLKKIEGNLKVISNDTAILKNNYKNTFGELPPDKETVGCSDKTSNQIKEQSAEYLTDSEIINKYLEQIEAENRYLDTKGIPLIGLGDNNLDIQGLPIILEATEDVSYSEAQPIAGIMKLFSWIPEDILDDKQVTKKNVSIQPVENIIKNAIEGKNADPRHIVFLGRSGSGKSTLIKQVAHLSASKNENFLKGYIPIVINLSELGKRNINNLEEYAINNAIKFLPTEIHEQAKDAIKGIGKDKHMFLIDAFDEIVNNHQNIARSIEQLRDRNPESIIIVTSRIVGYYTYALSGFKPYQIQELDITDIENLIQNWPLKASEHNSDLQKYIEERFEIVLQEIKQNKKLKSIVSSPLYLTFLLMLSSDPDYKNFNTESKLIQKYFDLLIVTWESKKNIPVDSYTLKTGYYEICYVIHRILFGDIKVDSTEENIIGFINGNISNAKEIFDFWIKAGIFVKIKKPDYSELVIPRHLSFLEYGFAMKLVNLWGNPATNADVLLKLKNNIYNKNLEETICMFVNHISNPENFIEEILDLPEDIYNRRLLLFPRIINEVKDKIDSTIIDDVKKDIMYNHLLFQFRDNWEATDYFFNSSMKAINILGNINDSVNLYLAGKKAQYPIDALRMITMSLSKDKINIDPDPLIQLLSTQDLSPEEEFNIIYQLSYVPSSEEMIDKLFDLLLKEPNHANIGQRYSQIGTFFRKEIKAKERFINLVKEHRSSVIEGYGYCIYSLCRSEDKGFLNHIIEIYNNEKRSFFDKYCLLLSMNTISGNDYIKQVLDLCKWRFDNYIDNDNMTDNLRKFNCILTYIPPFDFKIYWKVIEYIFTYDSEQTLRDCLRDVLQGYSDLPYNSRKVLIDWFEEIGDSCIQELEDIIGVEEDFKLRIDIASKIFHFKEKDLALFYLKRFYNELIEKRELSKKEVTEYKKTLINKIIVFSKDPILLHGLYENEEDLTFKTVIATYLSLLGDKKNAIKYLKEIYSEIIDNDLIYINRFTPVTIDELMILVFKGYPLSLCFSILARLSKLGEKEFVLSNTEYLLNTAVDDPEIKILLAYFYTLNGDPEKTLHYTVLLNEKLDFNSFIQLPLEVLSHMSAIEKVRFFEFIYKAEKREADKNLLLKRMFEIVEKENIMIYENDSKEWKVIQIPEKYDFS